MESSSGVYLDILEQTASSSWLILAVGERENGQFLGVGVVEIRETVDQIDEVGASCKEERKRTLAATSRAWG